MPVSKSALSLLVCASSCSCFAVEKQCQADRDEFSDCCPIHWCTDWPQCLWFVWWLLSLCKFDWLIGCSFSTLTLLVYTAGWWQLVTALASSAVVCRLRCLCTLNRDNDRCIFAHSPRDGAIRRTCFISWTAVCLLYELILFIPIQMVYILLEITNYMTSCCWNGNSVFACQFCRLVLYCWPKFLVKNQFWS